MRRKSGRRKPRITRKPCNPRRKSTVHGDFNDARFVYSDVATTFTRKDGKFMVRTDGPDGALQDYEAKFTFGVSPLEQYLLELPGGRLQALTIAWDTRPKADGGQRWFHLHPNETIRARRPAALDRAAAELELRMRGMPFDKSAQKL